jgi:hypothetical protein
MTHVLGGSAMFSRVCLDLVACAAVLTAAVSSAALAQAPDPQPSIAGLHIGDPASALAPMGPESFKPDPLADRYLVHKWILKDGTAISATVENASGKIAYLEADAAPTSAGHASDFPGFRYGVTTLTDIRAHMGSNGMGFQNRPVVDKAGDGIAVFNAYEVGGQVVTFITLVSATDAPKVVDKAAALGDVARLDAVLLASPDYLRVMDWGAPVKDKVYKPIAWR